MSHRNLSHEEIVALETQNCLSIDGWDQIHVSDDFSTFNIKNVTFSGKNYLGKYSKKIELPSGAVHFAGLYNAHLHNCTIKDECYIRNIGTSIANYTIEENVIIQNTDTIITVGESSFGNGTEVTPVNEAGGREVLIYDELSVHTAYLMVFYRHRPKLIMALKKSINDKINSIRSTQGIIGKNTIISNCGDIKNIKIGEFTKLESVTYLNNGSINSSHEAPTYVGYGVNAANFIISSSSIVSDGAYLRHCFVGQGCEISNSFTAENSIFFANSQCLQGEACSIFAGPYTVTHHKSTLLIAGYYSFFNAGSGTNQSNHMYKLGPVHQGVIERGGKTGSDSYVLWPAQIGAFTMILGRHYSNPDISSLPFSYLIEDGGKSILMPAQNIFNVGITRDVQKWPNRDKRKGEDHLDYITSEALNPYTINKIIDGIAILKQLQDKASPQVKSLMFKNTQISLPSINRGIKLYEQALVKYIGDELLIALKQPIFEAVKSSFITENKQWFDLAGLICDEVSLTKYIEDIENEKLSIDNWNSFYKNQFDIYKTDKQVHAFEILKSYFNIDISTCSNDQLADFIKDWMANNELISKTIIMDAKKELNVKSKIGFGIDGDLDCRNLDFEAVRGDIISNSFIKSIEEDLQNKANETKAVMSLLCK